MAIRVQIPTPMREQAGGKSEVEVSGPTVRAALDDLVKKHPGLGPKLFDMFFRRYSEKVWGRPCNQMSADWVSQRSKGLSIWTTITNAVLKPKKKAQSLSEEFVANFRAKVEPEAAR